MKQVMITGRRKAELLEVQSPKTPLGSDELEGSTVVTAISAGTELDSFGAYREKKGRYPAEVGYAAIFQVHAVGSKVESFKTGDMVYVSGRHASWQRVKASHSIRLPLSLPPEKAVITRLAGISWSTLVTTRARPPGKVAIAGLGPVGHLAAQIFNVCGYEVLAIDPIQARRKLARQKGIKNVMEALPLEDESWARKLELVVECSGHEASIRDSCYMVKKRGEIVLVGVPWVRRTEIYAHEIFSRVFYDFIDLRSGWECEVPTFAEDFRMGSRMEFFKAGIHWIDDGRINVDGLYGIALPEKINDVYSMLADQASPHLITLLDWRDVK